MMPKLNPRQMSRIMKQLGMSETKIDAKEVIIRLKDGNEIKIKEPLVSKIKFQGQETFTISGAIEESEKLNMDINEEDIELVVKQTGVSKEAAENALKNAGGDIAKAILDLEK